MTFGIVGFGNFGRLLANLLSPYGQVYAYDINPNQLTDDPTIQQASIEEIARCNIVILAVGIESMGEVCQLLSTKVSHETLVMDICSVKSLPVQIMKKHLSGKCQLLATHPLFGPQTTSASNIAGEKIVLYPIEFEGYEMFRSFLTDNLKLEIIELEPEEHDKEMAWVQALTFFVGRGLVHINLPKSHLSTGYYQKLLDLVELESSHSIELFNTVELGNPFAEEVRSKFIKVLKEIDEEFKANKTRLIQ